MTAVLQLYDRVDDRTVNEKDILPRLASYRMIPQLRRESIIDQAIASVSYTEEELLAAIPQFYQQNQLTDDNHLQEWLEHHSMSQEFLETVFIPRLLKIEKFKRQEWSHQLDSYFLDRKLAFEQATFSLIRLKEAGIAQELYYRLQEEEQTFAELAREYSLGSEANNNGLIGKVRLIDLDYRLAQMLHRSQPGQLLPPTQLNDIWIIVRLEEYFPAKLNETMRQHLLEELFEQWLQKQLVDVGVNERMRDDG